MKTYGNTSSIRKGIPVRYQDEGRRPFIKAVCTMSDWNEDSGYHCLLIAILCGVDVAESKLLYKYGPGHPLCKKILKKKLTAKETERMGKEAAGNAMYRLRMAGYTLEEISNAFGCYPSTAKRRIEKAKERKENMYGRPKQDRSDL